MANTRKRQQGSTDVTKRGVRKNASVGDLLARVERSSSPTGGALGAGGAAPPAVYQHNQTDLEFSFADKVRGGVSKNEVSIETIEIAHVGIAPR
jgi:hypothetical protein